MKYFLVVKENVIEKNLIINCDSFAIELELKLQ